MTDIPQAFDRNKLKYLDNSLREMVDAQYALCINNCIEKKDGKNYIACKDTCFR